MARFELPIRELRRFGRVLLLAAFLGLALAYGAFQAIFPNVSVPTAGEPSLELILGLLAVAAILAGFETEDLASAILEVFLSLPLAALVTVGLALSPLASGLLEARADELAFLVLRLGFPVVLFGTFTFFVGTLVGLGLRERFG